MPHPLPSPKARRMERHLARVSRVRPVVIGLPRPLADPTPPHPTPACIKQVGGGANGETKNAGQATTIDKWLTSRVITRREDKDPPDEPPVHWCEG